MRFKSRNVDDRFAARPGFIVAGKEIAACFDAASHSADKPAAPSRACGIGAGVIPPRLCGSTQSLVAADSGIGAPVS
jgi:hypothetical protein